MMPSMFRKPKMGMMTRQLYHRCMCIRNDNVKTMPGDIDPGKYQREL